MSSIKNLCQHIIWISVILTISQKLGEIPNDSIGSVESTTDIHTQVSFIKSDHIHKHK